MSKKGAGFMEKVPKSLRLQIGIFGRVNVGKSSFLNMVTAQDVSIVSSQPGTTTDIVEKVMEFRPLGPVVFLDTAGIDDVSSLSGDRVKRTSAVFGRADVFVLITENGQWGEYEKKLAEEARSREVPLAVVVNKTDLAPMSDEFGGMLRGVTPHVMACSCADVNGRGAAVETFRAIMESCAPDKAASPRAILRDLIPRGGVAVLVVPIDTGAPAGRLILPQVQSIRDALDGDSIALVVKETELEAALAMLKKSPDIVVCDSQVVKEMVAKTPKNVKCTTFSILFARIKADLAEAARGAAAIGKLKDGDRVLIAEACTHHAAGDDIGTVKIPRWLKQCTGADLQIGTCCGRDYPENLEQYSLIIHCGACMLTRREMLSRVREAVNKGIPITNYGMAISYFHGVLARVVEPFGIRI
jgi:[FeFe] hydrogenase H-cluster maturation GTPase HydF